MTGPAYDPGEASHRALRTIRHELEQHPVVSTVRGFPDGSYTSVVAELDPGATGVGGATLTVRWFAGEQQDADPEFSFHYGGSDADFGWHHEPNPYVDGWGRFQQREGEAYSYEPYSFGSLSPARVVWEVLARLEERLDV